MRLDSQAVTCPLKRGNSTVEQSEVLALIDKFLHAERGASLAGVVIHPLHWLALSAYYCPKREPFVPLQELVRASKVDQTPQGTSFHGLHWPLVVTDRTLQEIQTVRLQAELPTFTKIEWWVDGLAKAFPRLLGLGRRLARTQGLDA